MSFSHSVKDPRFEGVPKKLEDIREAPRDFSGEYYNDSNRKRKSLFDVTPQEMVGLNILLYPQLKSLEKDPRERKTIIAANIPNTVSETEIVNFFNFQMRRVLKRENISPVVSAKLNEERTQCILEFEFEEDASTCLSSLDGCKFLDEKIRLKPFRILNTDAPLFGTGVPTVESPNKLYIGSLPLEITEEQLRDLLKPYGAMKQFNMVKDGITGLFKGYAFAEFDNEKVTEEAIAGLNGKEVGSKMLLVQRANQGAKLVTNTSVLNINYTPVPILDSQSSIAALLNMTVKVEAAIGSLVATKNLSNTLLPTKVLILYNLFRTEDYKCAGEDFREIFEDVKGECRKWGKIKTFVIPKTKEGTIEAPGRVYIYYETVEQSQKAQHELSGRRFQGRLIITSYYPEEKFLKGIY